MIDAFFLSYEEQNILTIIYPLAYDIYEKYTFFDYQFLNRKYENECKNQFEDEKYVFPFEYHISKILSDNKIQDTPVEIILYQEQNDTKNLHINENYKQNLQKRLNDLNYLNSDTKSVYKNVHFDVYTVTSYLEKYFNTELSEYYILSMHKLFSKYGSFFTYSGSGMLLNDYKLNVLETIKEYSNYLYGTRYIINWTNTCYFKAVGNSLSEEEMTHYKSRNKHISNIKFGKLFYDISDLVETNSHLLLDDDIYIPIATSEWTINNIGLILNMDNTFICSGYFKSIEILLFKVLSKYFSKIGVTSYRGNFSINEGSKEYIEVGKMIYFLRQNLRRNVFKDDSLIEIIIKNVDEWRKNIRNGYFHKHMLSSSDVAIIKRTTYELIYLILSITPKIK